MRPLPGRTLFLLVVIAAVLWIGYLARAVVTPLLAALLLAYVLDPVVRRLERTGLSRGAASALVVFGTVLLCVGGAVLAATRLVHEATNFYTDVVGEPAAAAPTEAKARELLASHLAPEAPGTERGALPRTVWDGQDLWYVDQDGDGAFRPGYARQGVARVRKDLADAPWAGDVGAYLDRAEDIGGFLARSAGTGLRGAADTASSAVQTVLGILTLTVLFPIYLYYSLAKLAWVYDVTVRHLPAGQRDRIVDILAKIHETLSAFFRGKLILLFVRFVVLLGAFVLLDVPFSGVCALVATVSSLVPVLGSIAGAAVPVVLAVASGWDTRALLVLVATFVVWEVIEQYVLTPAVVGKRVGLHPLTILVATFVSGDLLGIFGLLVAIPLTAVLKILAIEFVLPEVRRQAGLTPAAKSPPEAAE